MSESLPPQNPDSKKRKIVFVDNSEALEERARDMAESRLTESREQQKGFKGWTRRIWKHNLFLEYYRQKEIAKAKGEILGSDNLYVGEGSQEDHDAEKVALVKKFTSEYDESIHAEAGEKRRTLKGIEGIEIGKDVKKLIEDFASQDLDDPNVQESFRQERVRLFSAIKGLSREVVGEGTLYANNLFEVTREVQQNIKHGEKLKELDLDFDIIVGKAKSGARTQAQFNALDRMINKVQKSKVGRFFNETTVASAMSLAYCITAGVSKRIASSKAAAWGSFGATAAVSATLGGLREKKRLEEERRQHARERATGKTFDKENSPRREEMERSRYETVESNTLAAKLERALYKTDGETRELKDLSEDELRAVLGTIADIEARTQISDQQKVDLISYSSVTKVNQERQQLDDLRGQVKADLRRNAGSAKFLKGKSVDEFLASLTEVSKKSLMEGNEGMEAKDKLFKAMRNKHVARAVMKGLATGIIVGTAGQEIGAFFKHGQEGLVKGMVEGHKKFTEGGQPMHMTMLEYLRRYVSGDLPHAGNGVMHEMTIGNAHVSLPDGVTMVPAHDGTFNLMQGGHVVANHIGFDAQGHISGASGKILAEHGVMATSATETITTTHAQTVGADEYIKAHPHEFANIHRKMWYENDTPAPVFDKNELRLDLNLNHHTGQYDFSVARMTHDGSYETVNGMKISADAHALAAAGKMKMLLSLSRGTQNHVVEIPIGPDFQAHIDPNSEIGKTFFEKVNGQLVFTGKFAEAAQVIGTEKDGGDQVRLLSTIVGKGMSTMISHVPTAKEVPVNIFNLPGDYRIDPPPFIPIFGRRPLEPMELKAVTDATKEYYYSGGGDYGLLDRSKYGKRISQELADNKELDLSGKDLDIVREYLAKQDPAYMADLKKMISGQNVIGEGIETIITVPAYQEGKNLEKTLRNYAKLKNKDRFEVVIFENHPEDVKRDNSGEVIEKIRKEFPDLNLIHLYKAFEEKPTIGEVRKYLVDAVLLRKSESNIEKSLAIVSNDADLEDISEDYADRVSAAFKNNKKLDAIAGKWDFPAETFGQYPLLHASQRLWHYVDIAFRNYYLKAPELNGRNSAFRSGTYAAVGGYNEKAKLAEDLEIGWLIKYARGYDPKRIGYVNPAWLISNPRRAVAKMASGGKLIQQYGDFHVNEDVRKTSIEDLLREKRDFKEKEFTEEAQSIYEHYARWKKSKGGWVDDEYIDRSFDRAMGLLGVKYKITDQSSIEITDASALLKGLEQYQKSGESKGKAKKEEKQTKSASTPAPEVRKKEVPKAPKKSPEKMGRKEYGIQEMKSLITEAIGDRAAITELELSPIPEGMKIKAKLKAKALLGATISLDGTIGNTRDGIEVKDHNIRAPFPVRNMILSRLDRLDSLIKEHLENKELRSISRMKIENGKLSVEFRNS